MGRHSKLPSTVPVPDLEVMEGELPTAQFAAAIKDQLRQTRMMAKSISNELESGNASPALAREMANLTRAMAALSAEQRQLEKHVVGLIQRPENAEERLRVTAEYIKELDEHGRGVIREALDDSEIEGGLLA